MSGLRIGTRGSDLAMWQARAAAAAIEQTGGPPCELRVIHTSGDRLREVSLSEVGGKRLFVKEIEEALIRGDIDLAVHSAKDLPAILPDGLAVRAVLPRDDPHDALVLPDGAAAAGSRTDAILEALGPESRIGTSSVRRIAQLAPRLPRGRFQPIRGNLDTRLRKLDGGSYDVIVLAAAGLRRLGFGRRLTARLPLALCLPAPGQGTVAIETRSDDRRVHEVVAHVNDEGTMTAVSAERALVEALGGGCQMPIAALATVSDDDLTLEGLVSSLDGSRTQRVRLRGAPADPEALGRAVAERLVTAGAADILEEVRRMQPPASDPS